MWYCRWKYFKQFNSSGVLIIVVPADQTNVELSLFLVATQILTTI